MNEYKYRIDKNFYSKDVVTKVVYWLNDKYVTSIKENELFFELRLSQEDSITDVQEIEKYISQLLSDFSLREIIQKETKDIRNIMYIKAFSNIDDFEEHYGPEI